MYFYAQFYWNIFICLLCVLIEMETSAYVSAVEEPSQEPGIIIL